MTTKIKVLVLALLCSAILAGCGDQRIFEQIGFALQEGVESKNGELIISFTLPVISEDKLSSDYKLITNEDIKSGREAREKSRQKYSSITESGKIQQIIFSSEFAEKGIHFILDEFQRDPINPVSAYLAVVEGSPKDMFDKIARFPEKPRPAYFIKQLLESNIRSTYIPETRIYNFEIEYYSEKIDPMLPLLSSEEKEIKVVGSALFAKDKMVGRVDTKQTSLLLSMMGKLNRTEYIVLAPDNSCNIDIKLTKVRRKITITMNNNKIVANISLKFEGDIDEYMRGNLDETNVERRLEKYASKQMKEECEKALAYTQQVGSDPLGIGNMVRVKYNNYWKENKWEDAYKNMIFNVDVDLNIRHYGVIK